MSDPVEKAVAVTNALKTAVEIAGDNPEVKEAGKKIASSVLTVASFVDNCLLPIAAINFGFEKGKKYFQEKFLHDVERATKKIPHENIIEPKPSIVAPILAGLTFAHSEDNLREMYLALLAKSMDGRVSESSHPAFVEVIQQITSQEAAILTSVLTAEFGLPICKMVLQLDKGYVEISDHILNSTLRESGDQVEIKEISVWVDNWTRLGLVKPVYDETFVDEERYSWIEARPEVLRCRNEHLGKKIEAVRGMLRITSFGRKFVLAVT